MSKIVQKIGERLRGRLWPLSNMYEHKENGEIVKVIVPWGSFLCAESAYQAAKNLSVAKEFENLSGFDARKRGRASKTRADWFQVNVDVMRQVLEAKFSIPKLATFLASTEGQLVEYNEHGDSFWGQVFKNGRWSGDNQLGRLLVELRNKNRKIAMPETTDIFKTGAAVLVNAVNICGTMDSGLAKQFKDKFPQAMSNLYALHCKNHGVPATKPSPRQMDTAERVWRPKGWMHVWQHPNYQTVVNLATKIGWERPAYKDLIENGLAKLAAWVNEHQPESIAIPDIGCGLGGLSWENQVKPLVMKAIEKFPAHTRVWVKGEWINKEEAPKMKNNMPLQEIRRYIPYAKQADIARLGVTPQDYAAFGYEHFQGRWCAQHVVLAANMEAVKNATSIFEVQTRWYDTDNHYMGEGAALIPTFSVGAAKDIFRNYVVKEFGAVRIMEFPDKRAPMLMYGGPAAFYPVTGEKLDWWRKSLKRGDIRCLNGESRRPDPKPSVKETVTADGRRVIEDEIIQENKGEINMKENNININSGNVIDDDDLELTEEFGVIDEAHRTYVPVAAADEYANVILAATVDEYTVSDAALEVAIETEVVAAAANHNDDTPSAPAVTPLAFTATTVLKPAGATKACRKMPGVIAGLNVAAALAANITMAEAARRMGEIRTLRAQLKALGKPGVEAKVPTRPQRVRGHKLDDAVTEYELFADFYKVLCEEFEAKYGVAIADEPEVATAQEQKEISPDVPDTATADEKQLPEKPEDPKDDPEDPKDPEEPSDDDNGDGGNEPANDNPPADPPVFDGGDNNNNGTGAPSDIAAASADQEVKKVPFADNNPADFYSEEGVPEETLPATPEELYGNAIRKVLRKYGNDTSSLGTVQLFLHEEHRLVVNFDTDESVEVDDESLDWVVEQIARQQVTNDRGYSPYGHDDLDDIDETSLTAPQQPQEPVQQPDPEPQQPPVEDSQLMAEYKAMIEKYLRLPNYVIDGGGVLSEVEVAELVAAKKQQDADTLTLGGQMLLAFFGDDTVRAAAELDAAINGYNPKKVKMTKLQEMQFSKRTTLKVIEGVRQDKEGNFYVKGSRGRLIHDWVRATVVNGIGFVFENPPKDKQHFFR